MNLLPQIAFDIAADDYVVTDPLTGAETLREPFGPDYAGAITIATPTIAQAFEMPCLVTAACQRFDVREPGGLPAQTYRLISALAFFQVLAVKPPAWLGQGVTASPKGIAAIIHAHQVGEAKLEEAKKNSASAGSRSSAPS